MQAMLEELRALRTMVEQIRNAKKNVTRMGAMWAPCLCRGIAAADNGATASSLPHRVPTSAARNRHLLRTYYVRTNGCAESCSKQGVYAGTYVLRTTYVVLLVITTRSQ